MNLAENKTVQITTDLNHPKAGKVGRIVYLGPPIVHVEFPDGVTNTFTADELQEPKPEIVS